MNVPQLLLTAVLVVLTRVIDVAVLGRWSWPQEYLWPGTPADLMLLVVVAAAVLTGPVTGATVGMMAGWFADLTPAGPGVTGVLAVLYGLAGFFAGQWRDRVARSVKAVVGAVLVASGIATGGQVIVMTLRGGWGGTDALAMAIGGIAADFVVAPIVVFVVWRFHRWADWDPAEVKRW
ncbi:MAG: hypothetical protein ACRCTR_02015 [Actinomycetota bacterium]